MHIKFLSFGTGDPRAAVKYLSGDKDHNGHVRAAVHVLRGNPTIVAEVAACSPHKHKYTSGVIAWAVEDAPTPEEIEAVLDDFEQVAFAGLEPDEYAWSAIQHVDQDGSTHVHLFVPRVMLTNGYAFNIAPPDWQRAYNPLRDYWNHTKGWARPDDPTRRRLLQPGRYASADKEVKSHNVTTLEVAEALAQEQGLALMDVLDVETALTPQVDPRAWITDLILNEILAGSINSRADVLGKLQQIGQISRASENFISLKLPDQVRPLRLKGRLFVDPLDAQALRDEANSLRDFGRVRDEPDPGAAAIARAKLAKAIKRRAVYNRQLAERCRPAAKAEASPINATDAGSILAQPPIQSVVLATDPITNVTKGAHHVASPALFVEQLEALLRATSHSIGRAISACLNTVRPAEQRRDRGGEHSGAAAIIEQAREATGRANRSLKRAHNVLAGIARRL